MKRPFTRQEKLLAISLLQSDLPHSMRWAEDFCGEKTNSLHPLLEARRLFKGMLIAIGLNPECPKIGCPCLAEYLPVSPSPSIHEGHDDRLSALQCRNEPKEQQTAKPLLENEQDSAELFRRLLVSACRA